MIDHVIIVGQGRVGGTLFARLKEKSVDVSSVGHVEFETWITSTNVVRTNINATPAVVVLAIPSESIKEAAQRIANATLNASHLIMDRPPDEDGPLEGILFLHTNGSESNSILAPLHSAGFLTAAAHPFQTFTDADPTALDGIAWGVECDSEAWNLCSEFVELTGGVPVRLNNFTPEQKRAYHASAVAASNLTYAAYDLARNIANDVGIDSARFLIPIMRRTVENAAKALESDESFLITGPLSRGDVESVQNQLMSVREGLRLPYALMSICLLDVVGLESTQRIAMQNMLESFASAHELA